MGFVMHSSNLALAREIVAPFAQKTLTRKTILELARAVEAIMSLRVAQMLTFGPDEVERIAESTRVAPDRVRDVLRMGGGNCVDAAGVIAIWEDGLPGGVTRDLVAEARDRIATRIRNLLHEARDSMRNFGLDTKLVRFDMRNSSGYWNEAFGMLYALEALWVRLLR